MSKDTSKDTLRLTALSNLLYLFESMLECGFEDELRGDISEQEICDYLRRLNENEIGAILRDLSPIEQEAVALRAGLRDSPWDYASIAKMLNCSKEGARKAALRGFKKLEPVIKYRFKFNPRRKRHNRGFVRIYDFLPKTSQRSIINDTLLAELNPTEQKALSLRYGLDGNTGRTYRAIGESLDLTTAGAEKLIKRALEKMKQFV